MEKNLENQLNDLMLNNPKKFLEIYQKLQNQVSEKASSKLFKPIFNKQVIDGHSLSDFYMSFDLLTEWLDNCLDDVRNHLNVISYPMYVYLYLLLLKDKLNSSEGKI